MDDPFATKLTDAARLGQSVVTVHSIRGKHRRGHGSGFFWSSSFHGEDEAKHLIVTNHHVVTDSMPRSQLPEEIRDHEVEYWIEIDRNRRAPARLLISDRLLDIAILEIPEDEACEDLRLPQGLRIRSSGSEARESRVLSYTALGEPVIRIGSPGVAGDSDGEGLVEGRIHSNTRLRNLVTFGIVGGREFPGRGKRWFGTELLLTDAPGFSGNSGGPVIAVEDQCVVGITAGGKYRTSSNPLGLLIDSLLQVLGSSPEISDKFMSDDAVQRWLAEMKPEINGVGLEVPAYWIDHLWSEYDSNRGKGQYLKRGSLGFENEMESFVRVRISNGIVEQIKEQETGIRLEEFPGPDTPASLAGLEHNDTIISFDGIPTEDPACLTAALTPETINRECKLEILRAGELLELRITPEEYIRKRFTRT